MDKPFISSGEELSDHDFAIFPYVQLALRPPSQAKIGKIIERLSKKKLTRLQHIANVLADRENQNRIHNREFVEPGHFYSVIPNRDARDKFLKTPMDEDVRGIDLQESNQLRLMSELAKYQSSFPFPKEKTADFRYHCINDMYSYGDGFILHAMMRHFCPKKIIEIGSGFSSAMMLDTNERWFNNQIELTFIEPYCDRLKPLLRPEDSNVKILEKPAQEVDFNIFETLQSGDFLFIDSTHVSKLGSDVNHIFFKILPKLAPGIFVHVHDVFWPFEYPKEWAKDNRFWNELYILRAFLMGNNNYQITWFNNFIFHKNHKFFLETLPFCCQNSGANFWMLKTN